MTFTSTAAFSHVLYIRTACGGPDMACSASAAGSAKVTVNLGAGRLYYVIVDGQAGAAGPFSLSVN